MRAFPHYLRYLISVYALLILICTAERITLLLLNTELLPDDSNHWPLLAVWNGLRFDSYISSFVVSIPLILSGFLYLIGKKQSRLLKFFSYYFSVLFGIICVFLTTDLAYFDYYNSRLSKGILSWMDSPMQMIEGTYADTTNFMYTGIAILMIAVCFLLSRWIYRRHHFDAPSDVNFATRLMIALISFFILFIGIRGSYDFSDKPLTSEKTIVSDHAFVNQSVANPVFNFFDSFRRIELNNMPEKEAIQMVQEELGRKGDACNPIFKRESTEDSSRAKNIVLLLVESLSNDMLSASRGAIGLTPRLDSLAKHGIFFSNFYSSGIHTHNGVFSTLYGMPTTYNQKPLADMELASLPFKGLPDILKAKGYSTSFFYTGDLQFDNMASFLSDHGFDELFGELDYAKEDIYNPWGLSDHYLYKYMIKHMDELSKRNNPFFISGLTVSTHHGNNTPKVQGFKPQDERPLGKSQYEYADWAIGEFIRSCSQRAWFENTIFVILGDHGQNFNPVYELPISYVNVPFIIYNYLEEGVIQDMAMQIDVLPTILGCLGMEYSNNGLGIDLFKERRPYAYFSSDEHIACIDQDFYYLSGVQGQERLFKYRDRSIQNHIEKENKKAKEMKAYVSSMLQTSQYMMRANKLRACDE